MILNLKYISVADFITKIYKTVLKYYCPGLFDSLYLYKPYESDDKNSKSIKNENSQLSFRFI